MPRSLAKGKRGERELAKALAPLFPDCNIRRGQQYHGLEGEDVVGLPGVHIEVKRTERLSLYEAVEQAKGDAAEEDETIPVVFHRRNKKPWLVILELDNLLDFVQTIAYLKQKEAKNDNRTERKS